MAKKGEGNNKSNGRELALRLLSAAILVPIVVWVILAGGYPFKTFLLFTSLLLAYEYERLTNLPKKSRGVLTAGVMASIWWIFTMDQPMGLKDGIVMAALLGAVTIGIGFILRKPQLKWAGFGMAYIAIPMLSLAFIYALTHEPLWIIWTLVVVWGCDTGAYAFGRLIGGPKLAPKISPNKTWAGFFGGTLAGALAGGAGAHYFGLGDVFYLAAGASLLAVWGQLGDLTESFIKRRFGQKDSGYLIPGHGGVLDRLDALLFAAPLVALALGTML